jgi:hypothetical protein
LFWHLGQPNLFFATCHQELLRTTANVLTKKELKLGRPHNLVHLVRDTFKLSRISTTAAPIAGLHSSSSDSVSPTMRGISVVSLSLPWFTLPAFEMWRRA